VRYRCKKFTFAISSPDEFLLIQTIGTIFGINLAMFAEDPTNYVYIDHAFLGVQNVIAVYHLEFRVTLLVVGV